MNTTASSARSRSASSNTITGFLPPSSKWRRLSVGAAWAWISDPVADSPTNAIALIDGCSVSARPADSPRPWTVFSTPGGSPASRAISDSSAAVQGDHSAGLCTTVQPAARAGAIFHVDSMNGVFHGVITPTGPSGDRVEKFMWCSSGIERPLGASGAWSAKNRKFSAPRIAAALMNRTVWPVSTHSTAAISSARSTIRSATSCRIRLRSCPLRPDQSPNAAAAARAAASMSSEPPLATVPSSAPSIGEWLSNVSPLALGVGSPSIRCSSGPIGEAAQLARSPWRSSPRTCGWLPWKLLRAAAQARCRFVRCRCVRRSPRAGGSR